MENNIESKFNLSLSQKNLNNAILSFLIESTAQNEVILNEILALRLQIKYNGALTPEILQQEIEAINEEVRVKKLKIFENIVHSYGFEDEPTQKFTMQDLIKLAAENLKLSIDSFPKKNDSEKNE